MLAEEKRNSILEKLAKLAPGITFGGALKGTLGIGAGAALLASAGKGIDMAYTHFADPLKKQKYMHNMFKEHPGLKQEPKNDVTKIFNTLYKFNPEMASDPLVSGSFIKRQLQFKEEGVQPMDVKTLAEVGKQWTEARKNRGQVSDALPTKSKDLSDVLMNSRQLGIG